VRHHRGVPEEEGLVRSGGLVEKREDRVHPVAADAEPLVAVASPLLGIAVGHPVGEAAVPVVPAPPLPRLEALVPLLGQPLRQRVDPVEGADHLPPAGQEGGVAPGGEPDLAGRQRWIVARYLVLMGVEPGEDRRQAGRTEAGRHVSAAEGLSLRGEPIEVGGPDVRVAHEGVVAVPLIVGDDHHDVRRRVSLKLGGHHRAGLRQPARDDREGGEEEDRARSGG
jgi:hypothetical protein